MLVKASGVSMGTSDADDYVEVRIEKIMGLLDDKNADDAMVAAALLGSRVDSTAKIPSVETILHALCIEVAGAAFVGHTHPSVINSILCSNRADSLVEGGLFPDQIVVLGERQLLIPYTDPGLELARCVRREMSTFVEAWSYQPRVIYLASHGMFALGRSADEVMQITEMATKSARILLGALSIGSPIHLSAAESARIDTRPDELKRRDQLFRRQQ
jgi:rhamnose utilization protein RhaD (predicted bifunctional aldolase and dehydrogenase)